MSKVDITINTSGPDESPVCIIGVRGFLDTESAGTLEVALNSALEKGLSRIIVDLAGVEYISSAGWGIFTGEIKEIRGKGGDIKLAAMQPSVYEVFQLLELNYFIQAFDSVEDAERKFALRAGYPLSQRRASARRELEMEEDVVLAVRPKVKNEEIEIPEKFGEKVKVEEKLVKQQEVTCKENMEKREKDRDLQSAKPPGLDIENCIGQILKKHPDYGLWKIRKELKEKGHTRVGLYKIHTIAKEWRDKLKSVELEVQPEVLQGRSDDEMRRRLELERTRLEEEWRKIEDERRQVEAEKLNLEREKSLLNKTRRVMKTEETPLDYISEIVEIVKAHPEYGPSAIQRELDNPRYDFIRISRSTVYRRLKKAGLNTKSRRMKFMDHHHSSLNPAPDKSMSSRPSNE